MALDPSTLGLSLVTSAIIPLIPKVKKEDLETVSLSAYVRVGNPGNYYYEKRKVDVTASSTGDHETILRTIVEFMDGIPAGRLNLDTGTKRKAKFGECLKHPVIDTWTPIAAAHGNTQADFVAALNAFVARYFLPTALSDQTRYLDHVKKPYRLTVNQLGERLSFINRLLRWLPGNNGNVPYTDHDLKLKLYNMMLDDWKLTFLASGQSITDANYTLLDLQRYMSIQEEAYNTRQERQRQRRGGSTLGQSTRPTQRRRTGNYQSNNSFSRGGRGRRFYGGGRGGHQGGRGSTLDG